MSTFEEDPIMTVEGEMSVEDELGLLRTVVEGFSGNLAQLVEVVGALVEAQDRHGAALAGSTSAGETWQEHVMNFERYTMGQFEAIGNALGQQRQTLDYVQARAAAHAAIARDARYDIDAMRRDLDAVRGTDEYRAALAEENPLITVRIATFNRPTELVERAIASVRRQTYDNWEVVVVSDGPSDANRAAVASVRDRRVRYFETPVRTALPTESRNRYQVGGAVPSNLANREARGTWIAQLDDDDEFTPDHLEKLLALARESQAEFVYGALIQKNLVTGRELLVWSDPPAFGGISLQASMYLRCLPHMDFDTENWKVDEPADWGLVRRMVAAGLRYATIRDVVGILYMVPYWNK